MFTVEVRTTAPAPKNNKLPMLLRPWDRVPGYCSPFTNGNLTFLLISSWFSTVRVFRRPPHCLVLLYRFVRFVQYTSIVCTPPRNDTSVHFERRPRGGSSCGGNNNENKNLSGFIDENRTIRKQPNIMWNNYYGVKITLQTSELYNA